MEAHNSSDHKTIGQVIRQRRMELGLTQEELAERIGESVRQSEISRLERDYVSLPRRSRLEAIARALEVTPGYLLVRSGWIEKESQLQEFSSGHPPPPQLDDPQPVPDIPPVTAEAFSDQETIGAVQLQDALDRARELSSYTGEILQKSRQVMEAARRRRRQDPS